MLLPTFCHAKETQPSPDEQLGYYANFTFCLTFLNIFFFQVKQQVNFGEYKSRLQVTKANFYHMILRPAYQNEEFYSIISIQGSHMQSLTAYFWYWIWHP